MLKCYGRLYLLSETTPGIEVVENYEPGEDFGVRQDENDGSLTLANIDVLINGKQVYLFRPMNSRAPWPLWCQIDDGELVAVFDDHGTFSVDMCALINDSNTGKMIKS